VAQVHPVDVLADFAHEMRQPLSALEALTCYLDLIIPEDARIREQLRRMHAEIEHADQILSHGLRAVRAYLPSAGSAVLARASSAPEAVVEELSLPLTSAAMASVAH
jgi:signal transduction histidine kinase